MFNILVKFICLISGLTMIYMPLHMIILDSSKFKDGLFLVPLSLGIYFFYLLYLLNKNRKPEIVFKPTLILKKSDIELANKEYISISDFYLFIKNKLLNEDIPDIWRERIFRFFEMVIDLMIKLDMSIKDIHRFYDLDSFVKYTYSISDNDMQIQYLNRLPGYGTDNRIAKELLSYLTTHIDLTVQEFMALMDNDMILYHSDNKDMIKSAWINHPSFSIIKNDFNGEFRTVDIIKQAIKITDPHKKDQYYSYLHFLYKNL